MNKTTASLSGLALLAAGAAHAQVSAYTPVQNQITVTPSYVYQTFDEFWAGYDRTKLSDDVVQHTGYLSLEYGILDGLALDLTMGYSSVNTDAFGQGGSDDGLTDTTFGIRYRVFDEQEGTSRWMPTLTVRLGGIIEGTYDANFPFSVGDGACGAEVSFLVSRQIFTGFGYYGSIGYRARNQKVPDDLFGSIGVYGGYRGFSGALGYRHVQGLSGGDIGDSTGEKVFNPNGGPNTYGFPEVKEINQIIEGTVGYTDQRGRYYSMFAGKNVAGKNTGDKWLFGASITLPFNLK
jgi:hypothetical protein